MNSAAEQHIRLDQFLKFQGVVGTGGQAKRLIQDGQVQVNDQMETRRGRKLRQGDSVEFDGQIWRVEFDAEPADEG